MNEQPQMNMQADIRSRFQWRKVHAPKTWRPNDIGAELVGYFGGRTLRDGQFGQYEVVIIHVPFEGSYLVSGTQLIQLLDAAIIPAGHPICIIWKGLVETAAGHKMKTYEVMVAEGPSVPEDALPEVQ